MEFDPGNPHHWLDGRMADRAVRTTPGLTPSFQVRGLIQEALEATFGGHAPSITEYLTSAYPQYRPL